MRNLTTTLILITAIALSMQAIAGGGLPAKPGFDMKLVKTGKYLASVGGCNDCHTPGYFMGEGKVSMKDWLTGDSFGWSGPWGTTYAANLRTLAAGMSEEQWVKHMRNLKTRPPMPWFTVRKMYKVHLRALYQFLRYLGPAGGPTPAYVAPGQTPKGPHATFPAPPPAKK